MLEVDKPGNSLKPIQAAAPGSHPETAFPIHQQGAYPIAGKSAWLVDLVAELDQFVAVIAKKTLPGPDPHKARMILNHAVNHGLRQLGNLVETLLELPPKKRIQASCEKQQAEKSTLKVTKYWRAGFHNRSCEQATDTISNLLYSK